MKDFHRNQDERMRDEIRDAWIKIACIGWGGFIITFILITILIIKGLF